MKPDEAEVQEDRMEGDQHVVLQEGVRPEPVGGHRAAHRHERVRRPGHQPEEEDRHDEGDQHGRRHKRVGGAAAEPASHDGEVPGEHERPQEDRPLESRPHAGDRVQQRRLAAVVVGHIGEREVVREKGVLHRRRRQQGAGENAGGGLRRRLEQGRAAGDEAGHDHHHPGGGRQEAEGDADLTGDGVHRVEPSAAFTRFGWAAT